MTIPSQSPQREDVVEGLGRLKRIIERLNDTFVAKAHIVNMMVVCAIAQEPMVIFGEPGTAKSAIVTKFCQLLGFAKGDYFGYMLTSFTEPDELLGAVDIRAYTEESVFRRVGKGGIQNARIVFLDEVFRGNSAILNTLLSIINERIYYESGVPQEARTQVVYGATNDAPSSQDLRAFFARFPVRLCSERVLDIEPLKLLDKGWVQELEQLARRSAILSGQAPPEPNAAEDAICSPAHLEVCQTWLRTYWGRPDIWADEASHLGLIKSAFFDVVGHMNRAGEQLFRIDDRKAVKLFKLVIAHSMIRQGPAATPGLNDVFAVLQHTWEDPQLVHMAAELVAHKLAEVSDMYRRTSAGAFVEEAGPLPDALAFAAEDGAAA
jgi:MoxR-like ATPase